MCTDHVNSTPTLLTIVHTMSILFFWSYDYIFTNYHIWKCAQTMLTLLQHCQQQSTSCLFFFWLFSPDFLAMFVLIAILGNAHRPCKHYSNIVYNSLHHVYPCFLFFFWFFLAIFALLTIFGNVHRPCKQYPNIVNNSLHHVCSFFLLFPDFLAIFMLITILGNAHRPHEQCTNIVNNSI